MRSYLHPNSNLGLKFEFIVWLPRDGGMNVAETDGDKVVVFTTDLFIYGLLSSSHVFK